MVRQKGLIFHQSLGGDEKFSHDCLPGEVGNPWVSCSRRLIRPPAKTLIQLWFSPYLCGLCGYMESLQGTMAGPFPYSGDTTKLSSSDVSHLC